jgi:DNA-binding transcriptional LysR family regulator
MRPIDPELLVTFVAIADLGGFHAAADKVGRSLSTVSMQMKRLESLFAPQPLFRQEGRRRELTATVQVLLAHARRILALNEVLWSSLVHTGPNRPVRLGAPEDFAGALLPPILAEYAVSDTTPIDFVCAPSQALRQMVDKDQLDIALVIEEAGHPEREIVRKEPLVWVSQPGRTWPADGAQPLALQNNASPLRSAILDAWASTGRPTRIALTTSSIDGLIAAARAGLAAAAIPACSRAPDLAVLSEADGFPPLPTIAIGRVFPRDREIHEPVARLLDILGRRMMNGAGDSSGSAGPASP